MNALDSVGEDPIGRLADDLAAEDYIADRRLATVLHLAGALEVPLLLEGEPGVGKTAVAEALARASGSRLVRLQCYEGLSAHHALYEWDYARQLLAIRIAEGRGAVAEEVHAEIFSEQYLLRRPLLDAIWPADPRPVVLLIDEVDRADEQFEALLLEILSQFQITVPEIGTISASRRPLIVLTANRARSLSDALRRRCLYHWIDFPALEREIEIVRRRVPAAAESLIQRGCLLVQELRRGYYRKAPGVSETIDWIGALTLLGAGDLQREVVDATVGCLLKDSDDLRRFHDGDGGQLLRQFGAG